MSVRGMEIHNGYLEFPEGMPQTLHMGTEASPLTQGEASQIIVSAVVNALALGGTVEAGIFIVIASVSLTGILHGLRAEVTVSDGVTVTPSGGAHTDAVFGAEINVEILGTGIVGGRLEGLRINMYSEAGSESESAVVGIFLSNYCLGTQAADNYHFVRLQENGTHTVYCAFYIRAGSGGIDYFAELHGNHPAWNALGAPATQSGWIRLWVGGLLRWIRLYSVAP